MAVIISALLLGPFAIYRLSPVRGIVAITIPFAGLLLFYLFSTDSINFFLYAEETVIWLALYWLLCAMLYLIAVYERRGKGELKRRKRSSTGEWHRQAPRQ
jgi:hypothetical protein